MRRNATAAALLLLAAVALPAAAEGASTTLQFDRMEGTEYPTAQTRNGKTSTLASIYEAAGVTLHVVEHNQDIAPLTGDDGATAGCITNAELDALAETYRKSPVAPSGERSYVYGVVVDHYAANYSGSECSTGVLGRMWDSQTRSAFAIFYKTNTISTNGEKYLRTTAHELGHAFNLHHQDGNGSTTIMNQSSVVGDDFTYDFSAHSTTHLGEHPDDCDWPGTGVFYGVDGTHHGWHDYTTVTCPPAADDDDAEQEEEEEEAGEVP